MKKIVDFSTKNKTISSIVFLLLINFLAVAFVRLSV